MQSKNPNRFFGLNPVGVPNNGRKDVEWNHDLPKTWRDAVTEAPLHSGFAAEAVDEASDTDEA